MKFNYASRICNSTVGMRQHPGVTAALYSSIQIPLNFSVYHSFLSDCQNEILNNLSQRWFMSLVLLIPSQVFHYYYILSCNLLFVAINSFN